MSDNMAVFLTFVFLTLLPWPIWRLGLFEAYCLCQSPVAVHRTIFSSGFLRGRVGKLFVGLGIYWAAVYLTLYFFPDLKIGLLVAGFFVAGFYLIRARTDYGLWSGMPPGKLTFLPIQPALDENYYLQKREKLGPIFKIGSPPDLRYLSFRPLVCIVDLKLGREFLKQHDLSLLNEPVAPFSLQFEAGGLRDMSDVDHKKYRKLHHRAYSNINPKYLDRICRECTQTALSKMQSSKKTSRLTGVDPRPFFDQMMFEILAQILFGIHWGSPQFTELMGHVYEMNLTHVTRRTRKSKFRPKLQKTLDFLRDYHTSKSSSTLSDTNREKSVLDLIDEQDRNAIFDDNVLCNLLNDFWSGRIDTTGLLTWTCKFITESSGRTELENISVLNDDAADIRSDNFVKEVLRLSQSEWLLRRVTKTIEFNNFRIKKGWNVRICVREAHRLPESFVCPHAFDVDRFEEDELSAAQYAPFGLYRHICIGGHIAHAASRALILSAATEFDIDAVQDGPLIHLWLHWAPSRFFKVAITNKTSGSIM